MHTCVKRIFFFLGRGGEAATIFNCVLCKRCWWGLLRLSSTQKMGVPSGVVNGCVVQLVHLLFCLRNTFLFVLYICFELLTWFVCENFTIAVATEWIAKEKGMYLTPLSHDMNSVDFFQVSVEAKIISTPASATRRATIRFAKMIYC